MQWYDVAHTCTISGLFLIFPFFTWGTLLFFHTFFVSVLCLPFKLQQSSSMQKPIKDSLACINESYTRWCKSWITHWERLYVGWLCLGVSMGPSVLLQVQCIYNLTEGQNSVISLVLFSSGSCEGKIAELHLPTLLLFKLIAEAVKPSWGFLSTSWHPPRAPKHDGWESWRAWIFRGQWEKKLGCCCLLRTLGCSRRIVCCFCNTAAGQWAGNPAKMKSVFVSGTASTDHCPLAVNELTLCFNQN